MLLTNENQRQLIPDIEIKKAFMCRPDIKKMTKSEANKAWENHLVKVEAFRQRLSGLDAIIV